MNIKTLAAVAATGCLVAACAGPNMFNYPMYKSPESGPTAKVIFLPAINNSQEMVGFALTPFIYVKERCGAFVSWRHLFPKGEPVIGRELTIGARGEETAFSANYGRDENAGTVVDTSSAGTVMRTVVRRYGCDLDFAFTPKPDSIYEVQYSTTSTGQCGVTVNERVLMDGAPAIVKVEDVKFLPKCN